MAPVWAGVVFVNLFALVVGAGVAGAVLPCRARLLRGAAPEVAKTLPSHGFPWFWVVFPLTCFSTATAFSMTVDPPISLSGPRRYADYFEPAPFTVAEALSMVIFAATVLGVVLSARSWRARRI